MFLALLLLGGCGPDNDSFHGHWANLEDGTWRAFHFFEATLPMGATRDDYELFLYGDGAEAERIQWGAYMLAEGRLVTEVYWPNEEYGALYGNDLLSFSKDAFTIETADGGSRTYTRVGGLP